MIPKSVKPLSEKIMLKQKDKARRAFRRNAIALWTSVLRKGLPPAAARFELTTAIGP
jgi:hypothetical protein